MNWTRPEEKLPESGRVIEFFAKPYGFIFCFTGTFREGVFASDEGGVVYDEFPQGEVISWRYK